MVSKIISLKNELINNKRDIEQNSKIIEDMASQIISLKKG